MKMRSDFEHSQIRLQSPGPGLQSVQRAAVFTTSESTETERIAVYVTFLGFPHRLRYREGLLQTEPLLDVVEFVRRPIRLRLQSISLMGGV